MVGPRPAEVLVQHLEDKPRWVVELLLAALHDSTGAVRVSWLPDEHSPGGPRTGPALPEISVPARAPERDAPAGGLRISAPVLVEGMPRGVVEVVPGPQPPDPALVEETATCVAVVVRSARLQADLDRWSASRTAAQQALRTGRHQLADAEARERSRLAATVLDRTGRTIGGLVSALEAFAATRARSELTRARAAADELVTTFRALARGVHPVRLRENGPGAALVEVGEELGLAVSVLGEQTRAGWEIETGIFWAVVGVLRGAADWPLTGGVVVRWASAGGRRTADVSVETTEDVGSARRAALTEALEADVRRLEALGGGASVVARGRSVVVTCWLPESFARAAAVSTEQWP